ncbi:hypothetical protein OWM54_39045 [Myxococcus sp. MISCRS1]|uniref:hypothetical protein n=1 Tax=Myxococcus TaxID=32 RepID=UPI001CBED429|nr:MULTISPECIES: hypothetical protein [unclassified Myxococcus]MBZ4401051.1 hypothetical protein [Myxococcus sp. AS-1-15]MBZ4409614.1 hypothetical protein [Myxococcus sp. XM-1-1-1]MCY1003161.1 hypothetical protein [Myxococcus sp. MISCRS1]BDT35257.1 lipoprotein [Myxococcus sp. MH1]
MRKLMMAVGAVAAMAMVTGCSKRDNVAEQRQDVAEAQSEARQEVAEIRQDEQQDIANTQRNAQEDIAESQREANEEIASAQEDVRDEQADLAEAQRDRNEELAQGGSGTAGAMAATTNVSGRVLSTSGSSLTVVDTSNNRQLKLKTNDQSRILQNNQEVKLGDLKEGDQVRASYVMDGKDMVVRELNVTQNVTPTK